MTRLLLSSAPFIAACALAFAGAPPALAAEPGWRTTTIAAASPAGAPTTVALWYPSAASPRAIAMGPFTVRAAPGAPPEPRLQGLVLLSHGTGGSELGHASLAEALARRGYLVAALRHPGDNWQDESLLRDTPERYFVERPLQARRVIDALLGDPLFGPRIATDARGPRVAVIGHSAGGYTALALVGARPDIARIAEHCRVNRPKDPIFCGMGSERRAPSPSSDGLTDPRVRAAVAMAPVGVVIDPDSLARIAVPVAVYFAQNDRFLVPAYHADPLAARIRGVSMRPVAGAGPFAFMDTPSMAIPSPDGDIGANPPGFDRAAFLPVLADQIGTFLDASFEATGR
jgi:predicted dienelactone hydrolase